MSDILARVRTIVGTTAEWAADDLVIGDGEIACERLVDGKVKIKCGDGLQKFSVLPYIQSDSPRVLPHVETLAYAAIVAPDFAKSDSFRIVVTGACKIDNPSNFTPGQSGAIAIQQDATGGHPITFGTVWKFEGGAAPAMTGDPNALDVLTFWVESATRIIGRVITDSK